MPIIGALGLLIGTFNLSELSPIIVTKALRLRRRVAAKKKGSALSFSNKD
jgi:hypothetical protein